MSSGAIAAGVGRLRLKERPSNLHMKQAVAAVGQLALMKAYEEAFSLDFITPAQILLTRDDLMNGDRYLNVRHTLLRLLALKTIPIINENDSVSTEEIQVGDNDTLSALVAVKIEADKLILLSDVPGYFKLDSKGRLTKEILTEVEHITPQMEKKASHTSGTQLSVGGIATKLRAAKMATSAGIETWIASGFEPDILKRIMRKAPGAGTCFLPKRRRR